MYTVACGRFRESYYRANTAMRVAKNLANEQRKRHTGVRVYVWKKSGATMTLFWASDWTA